MDEKFFTECPHCRTAFRVVRNSIGSSHGWVKCGRCRKVFNANTNAVDPIGLNEEKTDKQVSDLILTNVARKKLNQDTPQMPLFKDVAVEQAGKQKKPTKSSPPVASSRWQALNTDDQEDGSQNAPGLESKIDSAARVDSDKVKEKPSLTDIQVEKVLAIKDDQLSRSNQKRAKNDPTKASKAVSNELDSEQAKKISFFDTVDEKSRQIPRRPEKAKRIDPQKSEFVTQAAQAAQRSWSVSKLQKQQRRKDRNRIRPQGRFKSVILSVLLFFLLFWQVNIVSYNKLVNYDFLKPYLNVACLVFVCNKSSLAKDEIFDIFQAGIKPHPQLPGIFNLTARLINYSDSDQLLPSVILDLTNQRGDIIASKRVNLVENPQYIEPSVRQLIPGQDVKLIFNIDQLQSNAVGFNLRLQP